MKKKLYTVTDLLRYMNYAGLPSSRMWIRTSEAKGTLISPRLPTTRKDRVFTEKQIEQIVQAFSPGGTGRWP